MRYRDDGGEPTRETIHQHAPQFRLPVAVAWNRRVRSPMRPYLRRRNWWKLPPSRRHRVGGGAFKSHYREKPLLLRSNENGGNDDGIRVGIGYWISNIVFRGRTMRQVDLATRRTHGQEPKRRNGFGKRSKAASAMHFAIEPIKTMDPPGGMTALASRATRNAPVTNEAQAACRFAASQESTRATISSTTSDCMPCWPAMVCTRRSTRSMSRAPPASARAAEEGRIRPFAA